MKAILLAGGEGLQLRPITSTRPKPFVPIGNRMCIDYVLDRLAQAGVTDAIIATCYKPETIMTYLGSGARHGLNLSYSVEDDALGTAGAVKKMEHFLNEPFIVASGDVFADVDIAQLVRFHADHGGLATVALTRVEDAREFGLVVADADGRVTRVDEKPARDAAFADLVNAGIYVLDPAVLKIIPPGTPFDFARDLFPMLIEKGEPVHAHELSGVWIDIGRASDLLRANQIVCAQNARAVVAKGAEVAPSAYLDHASIGAGSTVAARVRVQRSIVFENTAIASECVIKDSIIGAGVQVGQGARIEGTVVGDDVVIEGKAELKDTLVEPGDVVQRLAPAQRIVR